jgi:hypothetical protein
LKKERRLRALRRIFGTQRDEVTGEWKKNYMRSLMICTHHRILFWWAGHVAGMGERNVYSVLVGKPEGKRPLRRTRRRWEDNMKMDLQEGGCGGLDWIKLAQGRNSWRARVNTVMNLRVP